MIRLSFLKRVGCCVWGIVLKVVYLDVVWFKILEGVGSWVFLLCVKKVEVLKMIELLFGKLVVGIMGFFVCIIVMRFVGFFYVWSRGGWLIVCVGYDVNLIWFDLLFGFGCFLGSGYVW